MFEKALEIEPTHRADAAGGHRPAAAGRATGKRSSTPSGSCSPIAEEPEKVKLLDEIGDIYHEKLQNAQKAIAAYLEALEVAARQSRQLLHKVLDLYSETKQWKKAVEIIERIAELETDPIRSGKYYHAAARICRDELKSLDDAIEYFNQRARLATSRRPTRSPTPNFPST